jgi:hypothetical protein
MRGRGNLRDVVAFMALASEDGDEDESRDSAVFIP